MTKMRFTPWVALACIGALAGCTTDDGQVEGNTQLNVVIPNGTGNGSSAPAAAGIGVVEYTIVCDDGIDLGPFLENGATIDNDVTINGVLEVLNADAGASIGADFGPDLTEVFVWQGFMDLPPTRACTVQLRARDADGEVICTATQTFGIAADSTTKVNVLMQCDVSFQAPVGMLDLDADFQFNVSNFCPNLYVLNCVDSFPTSPLPGVPPTTYCETRYQDDDGQCGASCDPQTCDPSADGLTCTPGPDNGVSTTVTCDANGLIDCEGDFNFDGSCTWNGAATGTTGAGVPVPVLLGGPGPEAGGFFVACSPAAPPGSDVTCTAVTTDGDVDCDKSKTVTFTCPGLNFCDQTTAGDNLTDCDDGNECTTDSCDRVAGACVNDNVPAGGGNNCTTAGGGPGECDGAGFCGSFGCTQDSDCDNPNTECLTAPAGACDLGTGICAPEVPGNDGASCDSGTGSGVGICNGGSCDSQDACSVPGDCPGATECVAATCTGAPLACGTQNEPAGTPCTSVPNGACDGNGACAAPPVIGPGLGSSTAQAIPTTATGCTYDAVETTCTGCTVTGPEVPNGGQCGQFGTQIVRGCEVPGGVLNAQLAIAVDIISTVSSDGAGNITHGITIDATNPALGTAAGLVTVDAADIFTDVTSGNPSTLTNSLNPEFAGQVLGAFTGGSNILLLDNDAATGIGVEIPDVTTAVVPTSTPSVNIGFGGDFALVLTITASGTALNVDSSSCIFDTLGGGTNFPVN